MTVKQRIRRSSGFVKLIYHGIWSYAKKVKSDYIHLVFLLKGRISLFYVVQESQLFN